jgi:hypothetical protein
MNTKRAGLYLRVSTDDQTIENQRQSLCEALNRRGWQIVEEFADEGISGAKGRDKRPAFDRLLRAATRRKIDVVAAQRVSTTGLTSKKSPNCCASFYRRSSAISSRGRPDSRRSSCSLDSPARARARLAASCASYSANRMSSVSRWPLSITTSAPRT